MFRNVFPALVMPKDFCTRLSFTQKRENERRQAEEKKHKEEVEYLTRHAKQLKSQLETVLQPGKK